MKEYDKLRELMFKDRQTHIDEQGDYWAVGNMEKYTGAVKGIAIDKLADLENKIENGTLIELPCKYGDTVWFVYEVETDEMVLDEGVIQSFSIDSCGLWFYVIYKSGLTYWHTIEVLGERAFLTKAEAEKKLEELKNENTRKQQDKV